MEKMEKNGGIAMHLNSISKNRLVSIAQSTDPALKSQLLGAIFEAMVSILPLLMQFIGAKEEASA